MWLGITPARRQNGSLGTPAELGDGDSFEDLLAALASPALAAVTVMHASPEVIPDAIELTRRCFAGPVGGHAETGSWTPPNWGFTGLTPSQYLQQATTWADRAIRAAAGPQTRFAVPVDGTRHTLRWLIAHMTSETARHAGHADILREQLEGATGR